jgi:hypothetical protein
MLPHRVAERPLDLVPSHVAGLAVKPNGVETPLGTKDSLTENSAIAASMDTARVAESPSCPVRLEAGGRLTAHKTKAI